MISVDCILPLLATVNCTSVDSIAIAAFCARLYFRCKKQNSHISRKLPCNPCNSLAVIKAIFSWFSATMLRAHHECLQTNNWSVAVVPKWCAAAHWCAVRQGQGCVYYRALVHFEHFEHLLSVLRALTLKNQNNSVH